MFLIGSQLEKSRKECEDLARELRRKDQEVERARQESQMEIERVSLPRTDLNHYSGNYKALT